MSTILQQGRFTSNGQSRIIPLRSDVDWMKVLNWTIASANQTTATAVEFYWQRGFPNANGIQYLKSNAANASNLTQVITTNGFTLANSSLTRPGNIQSTITGITTGGVVTNTGVNGLVTGDIARLSNITGGQQLGGIDFTVTSTSNTAFTLAYDGSAIGAAATTGSFRRIPYQPYFYPRHRTITSISQAASAVVAMSVTHEMQVGQTVRLRVPDVYNMVEINGLMGTITAVNTTANTITLDINSSDFTSFAFPQTGAVPFDLAQVIPVGSQAAGMTTNLTGASRNTSEIGMLLGGGATGPGGANTNVMYWSAGKSERIDNS